MAFLLINAAIFIKSLVDITLIYNDLDKTSAEYADYLLKIVFYTIVVISNYYFNSSNGDVETKCFLRNFIHI